MKMFLVLSENLSERRAYIFPMRHGTSIPNEFVNSYRGVLSLLLPGKNHVQFQIVTYRTLRQISGQSAGPVRA